MTLDSLSMSIYREEHSLITQHTSEMVCLHDVENTIRFASPSAHEVMGFGPELLIGRKLTDFLSDNFINEMDFSTLMRFFDQPGTRIRYQVQHKDRRLRWLETNFEILGSESQNYHSISTTRDISDSVQLTEDLMDAFSKEQEMSKFKTNLYSVASHEFKTPLAVIQANIEMLKVKQSPKLLSNGLQTMEEEVDRLNTMITDMLELRKLSLGQRNFHAEPTNLVEMLEEIIDETTGKSRNNAEVKLKTKGTPEAISLDYSLMRYVFTNLLSNALKFSRGKPKVIIELRYLENQVDIAVTDKGIGIPESEQVKIFQSFYRAKNASNISGTGVGLSIVMEFVKLHKGKVNLSSEEGKGSTFLVTLPKS